MAQELSAVEIAGLSKQYRSVFPWARQKVNAVDELSLCVPGGEIFGLLGPNGAGKTTTIKILCGLIEADRGQISYPAFGRPPRIGAVLEGSRNLYWRLSPLENIFYFGEVKGVSLALLKRQAQELLTRFGLWERRNNMAQTLSRGMQQKLAVVLALLGDPELLLLDEPTLGLDVASSIAIQQLLRQLCAERQLTIIVTTHQMDIAQALCRRVGIMRDGRIAACAPVSELVDHFRRQDYIARFDESRLAPLRPQLEGYSYDELPSDRPGQVVLRFRLLQAEDVYPLMAILGAAKIRLLDFHQEVPTLEDVFLSIAHADDSVQTSPGDTP